MGSVPSVSVRVHTLLSHLYVELQWDGPDVGMEVEETVSCGSKPLAQVLGVGHGRAESHDPHLPLDLRGHVAHAGADDLQDGPALPANQVQLVHHKEIDVLYVLPLLPSPGEDVPVLWRANDDVALCTPNTDDNKKAVLFRKRKAFLHLGICS